MPKLLSVAIFAACVLMCASKQASATILTFDDLNSAESAPVPSSLYSGLTFNGWWAIANPPYSYPYASSPTIIFNAPIPRTNTPEIISELPIDVISIYLANYVYTSGSYGSGIVGLRGYSGSSLLYSLTVLPVVESMTQYTINFKGIDRFVMTTDNGYAFMDNFEYVTSSSSIPEPTSLALIGLGLAGLGFSLRHKQT